MISDETVLEVKRSVDIVEVVSAYFPLKRRGANYWAPCPFHEEKTPSFSVHAEKQIFKCFGCGKAGSAITFVMEYLKVEYPEAIRVLAERAGIPVKYSGRAESGPSRDEIQKAVEWADGVFRGLLRHGAAEGARQFLGRRGVTPEGAELFGLGYSMESWDYLLDRGRRNGMGPELLAAAGLVRRREGKEGHYDFFRGRLMFPILERTGRPIAFGARTLRDEEPKFINSPESKLFSKGRGFYGLHLAKEEWEETRTAYVVEGYLDVVIPYQAGVRGLVATLGTALTRDHLKVLRRYVDKVVLVFDADPAGRKASERGLDLLLSEDLEAFVAGLPEGLDPDDVVRRSGPEELRRILGNPREVFEFLLDTLTARHGDGTAAAKTRVVEEVLKRIATVPNGVKREFLLQQLARRFGMDERTLRERLGPEAAPAAEPAPASAEVTPLEEAARGLLSCAVASPEVAREVRRARPAAGFPTEATRKVAEAAWGLLDRAGAVDGSDLVALLRDPEAARVAAEVVGRGLGPEEAKGLAAGYADKLDGVALRRESVERRARFKAASTEEERDALLRQVMEARRSRPEDRGLLPGRQAGA